MTDDTSSYAKEVSTIDAYQKRIKELEVLNKKLRVQLSEERTKALAYEHLFRDIHAILEHRIEE